MRLSLGIRTALVALAVAMGGQAASAQTPPPASPFASVNIRQLVLRTPGVTRSATLSTPDKLYVTIAIDGKSKGGGFIVGSAVSSGQTIDGDWLLAVPLFTADKGTIVGLVYYSDGGTPEFAGTVDSKDGHLSLTVHDGHLFARAPFFEKHDPPCCPSHAVIKRILYSRNADGLIEVSRDVVDIDNATPFPSANPSEPER
jgi:hypothetical protein